jgi:peptidoglycan/xylan/chitin deacetylase (PgdA/CDA1 family)
MLKEPIADRCVCVTFDDGYYNNLEIAVPILRDLGMPATIFVPTAIIDGTTTYSWLEEPPRALTWSEITELVADELFDVQAHSCTHALLPKVDDRRAWTEIAESKREIEQHVPYTVTSFCFPAGLYGEREIRFVQEAGYRAALTTDPGVNKCGDPLHTLRRTLVYSPDDSGSFQAKLAGLLDRPPHLRDWLYRRLSRSA